MKPSSASNAGRARTPQYIEVPPNIEAKHIVSNVSTVLSYQSNSPLIKDVSKPLIFQAVGRLFAFPIIVLARGANIRDTPGNPEDKNSECN